MLRCPVSSISCARRRRVPEVGEVPGAVHVERDDGVDERGVLAPDDEVARPDEHRSAAEHTAAHLAIVGRAGRASAAPSLQRRVDEVATFEMDPPRRPGRSR